MADPFHHVLLQSLLLQNLELQKGCICLTSPSNTCLAQTSISIRCQAANKGSHNLILMPPRISNCQVALQFLKPKRLSCSPNRLTPIVFTAPKNPIYKIYRPELVQCPAVFNWLCQSTKGVLDLQLYDITLEFFIFDDWSFFTHTSFHTKSVQYDK